MEVKKDLIKENLGVNDDSNSLDFLIFLATRLDNHLWEHYRERTGNPPPLGTYFTLQIFPSLAALTAQEKQPMQLG